MPDALEFDPERIIAVLERHAVDYVLIGGLAATIHGAAHITEDIDITPDRAPANLDRLSRALLELDAKVRTVGVEGGLDFAHDGTSLGRAEVWNLVTRHGQLDISFTPSGTGGYDDLRTGAVTIRIAGIDTRIASLADVVRSKEAAGRPKDLQALPTLRALLELLEERDRPG